MILKLICRDRPTLGLSEFLSLFTVFVHGDTVEELEEEFARYVGTDFAIAFPTGRTALYYLYKSIASGKEVIVPSYGCIPIADSVIWSGNIPRFADISLDSYNIDPKEAEGKINEKTAILSPVHLYGLPAEMDILLELKEKHDLFLVEDAAMSLGAEYKGKRVGSFGDAAMFSLERSKMITSYHGGVITTNSEKLHDDLQRAREELKAGLLNGYKNILRLYLYYFATHPHVWKILSKIWSMLHPMGTANVGKAEQPMPPEYLHAYSPLQAEVALNQLKKIDYLIRRRRANAAHLNRRLEGIEGLVTPKEPAGATHIYARYVVRISKEFGLDRNRLRAELKKRGIDAGYWYNYSLPYTEFYRKIGDICPNGLKASEETLALPDYPLLSQKDMDYISEKIIEIKTKYGGFYGRNKKKMV